MDVKIVDISALAASVFSEPEAEFVAGQLAGSQLLAPVLLGFELAIVCLVKARRHPDLASALIEAFRLWDRLGVEEILVDHVDAVTIATETGLTAYDASYLWLSRRLGAPLVTLDRKLARAAMGGR